MKKKVWMALMLAGVVMAAGCGKDEKEKTPDSNETATEQQDQEADTESEQEDGEEQEESSEEQMKLTSEILKDVDIEKCVTLGEYKGIDVEKIIKPVLDEEVESQIQYALEQYPIEITDRVAQNGDMVNINYVGKIDGEAFEGGSAENSDLYLGSKRFIEGFEEGLVGASKGEERVLDLQFPEDYHAEELAGKDVQFTVTVNAIKAPLDAPTDEWVAANIEGCKTVDEFREFIRSSQEENNKLSSEDQARNAAWMQVVEGSTINEYPQELVDMGAKLYVQQAETYAMYAGMEVEDLIKSSGMTMEQFEENKEEFGKNIAAQALVSKAISDAEGFVMGDEEYKKIVDRLVADFECVDEADLIAKYGQDNVEQTVMLERVTNLILENANIKEVQESEIAPPEVPMLEEEVTE